MGPRVERLAQVGVDDWIGYTLMAVGGLVALVVLRLVYVWYTRIRPLQPSLTLSGRLIATSDHGHG